MLRAKLQQFVGAAVQIRRITLLPARLGLVPAREKAAAEREVIVCNQRRTVGGQRLEVHAVRMSRQLGVEIEDDVGLRVETDLADSGCLETLAVVDGRQQIVDAVGIDRLGLEPRQAEQNRLVRAVALARPGERSVQTDAQRGNVGGDVLERQHERARALHRPDRVRTGRSDADLEDIENTHCGHGVGSYADDGPDHVAVDVDVAGAGQRGDLPRARIDARMQAHGQAVARRIHGLHGLLEIAAAIAVDVQDGPEHLPL